MPDDKQELTLAEVHRRTEEVLELDRTDADPEVAHGNQDAIYVDILRAVIAGHPDAAAMAEDALRIKESGGRRWGA